MHYNPAEHFSTRILDMENKSDYGMKVAAEWKKAFNQSLKNETYPVVHPIGQEKFALFGEFPTGIFEYALHIDGATSLIKEKNSK